MHRVGEPARIHGAHPHLITIAPLLGQIALMRQFGLNHTTPVGPLKQKPHHRADPPLT